jgi:16S rRNA (cytidine1402-2'-O)-methyltransferase
VAVRLNTFGTIDGLVMPGILYVVATPIGNLEDVTLRALRVLREVAVIAAEDTRRTARLLQHYSISTPTTSLHEHNERSRTPGLIGRLLAGESSALGSDAGTPVVSDPGSHLVAAAHAAGVRVEPVPGPNAALALLSASGLRGDGFVFVGFPPIRSKARYGWLVNLAHESRLLIIYEAPHRIRRTLDDMLAIFGDRLLAIGRELTKVHESLAVRPISEHIAKLGIERGEFTLVVQGRSEEKPQELRPSANELAAQFGEMTNNSGSGRREAIRELAGKYGIPAREVFALLEQAKIRVD